MRHFVCFITNIAAQLQYEDRNSVKKRHGYVSLEFKLIHMDLANDIYKQPQKFNLHKLDILMKFKIEEFSVVSTSIFDSPIILRSISYFIMYALHTCSVTQLCLTLCKPMTVAHQVSLSMKFSRQEYWCGLPSPPPGDLTNADLSQVSYISRQFLYH